MGEWFTNRSNHIHMFTPITRIVATKVHTEEFSGEVGNGVENELPALFSVKGIEGPVTETAGPLV